jgi:hypothetical protein
VLVHLVANSFVGDVRTAFLAFFEAGAALIELDCTSQLKHALPRTCLVKAEDEY